jgi:hypothetical protein
MVNKEYVCSVKKGHLYSGSVPDQAAPPECCGKPMVQVSSGMPMAPAESPALDAVIVPGKRSKKKK